MDATTMTEVIPTTTEIPLSLAAYELRKPWRTCYDWLLSGKLEGRKIRGRWVVDVASVHRVQAELTPSAA